MGNPGRKLRRAFPTRTVLAVSVAALGVIVVGLALVYLRTPPLESTTFTAGRISNYPATGVSRDFKPNYSVFLVRLPDGKLVALSATRGTPLGCIVNWLPDRQQFQDPCHGTLYDITGVNRTGPGPRPLERFKIYVDGDNVVVDTSVTFQQELGQWKLTDSYIDLAAQTAPDP